MLKNSFSEKVWQLLSKIHRGRVSTYKQVAIALGNPKAARAVGNACNANPFSPKVPCHRVVKSNGLVGGYAQGSFKKHRLLEKEGIMIKNKRIVNFNTVLIQGSDL